jgi:Mg2+ and Co2+ transporter CorA
LESDAVGSLNNDGQRDAAATSADHRQPAVYANEPVQSPLVSGHPPGDDVQAASSAPSHAARGLGGQRRAVRYADANSNTLAPLAIPEHTTSNGNGEEEAAEDGMATPDSPQWMSARDMSRRASAYLISAGQTVLHFGDDDSEDDNDLSTTLIADSKEDGNHSPRGGDAAAAGEASQPPPESEGATQAGDAETQQPSPDKTSAGNADNTTGESALVAIPGLDETQTPSAARMGAAADAGANATANANATPNPRPKKTVTHRMKHAAFAQLTVREGERFMVLEQQGTSVPILRDFDSAKSLFGHLTSQQPDFRALGGGEDSDADDAEVESGEMDAKAMERELNRRMGMMDGSMGRSASYGGGGGGSNKTPEKGRTPAASSSSSSSTTSTMSGLVPPRTMWIDVQTGNHDVIESLLSYFPRLDRDTIDDVEQHDAVDTAHWFAHSRYLFANIECFVVDAEQSSFSFRPEAVGSFEGMLMSSGRTTIVSLIAFSDVCITIHSEPFMGHRGSLQALYGTVARRRKGMHAGLHMHAPGSPRGVLGGEGPMADVIHRHRHRTSKQKAKKQSMVFGVDGKKKRLTVGSIVAHVVENMVIAGLPDPTSCLGEVDRIDEMVLLVTNDSHDLLRRIARVRRILSAHRSSLFRKERFLKQFTSPALRATFISGFTAEQYRHTLGEVFHVAERLEAARDVLTQANSNFVSHISLQVAQVSNQMNFKMKALSQVATVCLPLNIITGLFGMNVTVPYNSTDYPSTLWPFFTIVGSMICLLLMGIPFIWRSMQSPTGKPMGALES